MYERPTLPVALLLRPPLEGALTTPAPQMLCLGYNTLPGLGPTCLWSCQGPCLPEGPPVLLFVFQRQPEASLTLWLVAALLSHLELAPGLPVSPGCLMWQCSSISGTAGALGLLQGLPQIEEIAHSL